MKIPLSKVLRLQKSDPAPAQQDPAAAVAPAPGGVPTATPAALAAPEPATISLAGQATPAPIQSKPRRKRGFRERMLDGLTGWSVVSPALAVAAALFAWSLYERGSDLAGLRSVNARELTAPKPAAKPVTEEDLASLRQRIKSLNPTLVQERTQLAPILSLIELKAHHLGWRDEMSTKPEIPMTGGMKDLTVLPVSVRLIDSGQSSQPGHLRLLTWLRELDSLGKRVEVSSLQLRTLGNGLSEVQVELLFFGLKSHEETSPK